MIVHSRGRKLEELSFETEESHSKNMAESTTPIGAKSSSVNVIDITDIDDEPDISHNVSLDGQGSGNISLATCFTKEEGNNLDNNHAQNNEENLDFGEDTLFAANTKRKRPCNVVMSESESDHDDDGLSNSITPANLEVDKVIDIQRPRRCLQTLRKLGSKNRDDKTSSGRPHKVKYQQSIPKNDDDDDDDLGVDLSYSEEGNISDFIVDDVNASDCEDMSDKSQDESNSDLDVNSSSTLDLQDVSDSQGNGNISLSTCTVAERRKDSNSNYAQKSEENTDLGEDYSCAVIPKRKQTRNVVMSESENDDEDDDLPISKLMRNHVEEVSGDELVNVVVDADADGDDDDDDDDDDMPISQVIRKKKASRRRLKRLRKCVSKSHDDKTSSCIPTNDDSHEDNDDELEEELSNSEGESLNDFIDDDSDVSEINSNKSQDGCDGDVDSDDLNKSQDLPDRSKDSDSQDVSDGELDFRKILSKIKREKRQQIKWEYETDMRADFGKDPELCMKAVCVLYRQEMLGDQMYEETFGRDGRGFNKYDAARGCALGRFLADDSPYDGLKKTEEELDEYNPEGVEICGDLALKYSKQIFEIFMNNEDPHFP